MTLPPFTPLSPELLTAALVTLGAPVWPAAEVAAAAVEAGREADVDARWLAAVAWAESGGTLAAEPRGAVTLGVCQVHPAWSPLSRETLLTRRGSVFGAAILYARIVRKHGRWNAHLVYGCGMDRCGGVWHGAARWKRAVWRQLVLTRRGAQGE